MKLIIKQLEFVVYVKFERIEIVFIKLVVYVKIVVLKKFHNPYVILLYIDLLLINMKRAFSNQYEISNNILKNDYKLQRLHEIK